jgi:TfoX/Sxy family transcriptional regulator of competence genes
MNDDDRLAAKTRAALARLEGIHEVRMFGGIGFMLNGNLLAGVSTRGLLLRIGEEHQREALSRPGIRPMVMRGRTMKDYVYIDPASLDDGAIKAWLKSAVVFVKTLPPKRPRSKAKAAKARSKR